MQIKRFHFRVFGIDDQRVGGDLFARLQAAINRATDQQLSQALALSIRAARQSAQSKAGNGISREFFPVVRS